MTNAPLISIIFPIYNSEKYLEESLDSLLSQTYVNIEIIALDDGSTDSSYKILKSYTDTRLKIYRSDENKGLIYQLNFGIMQSKGEYIARMDSDDIAMPERIEKQLKYLRDHPEVGLCGTFLSAFSENSSRIWSVPIEHNNIAVSMLFDNSIYHPTVFGKKEIFLCLYDQKFKHVEDYELWTRLIRKNVKFGNLSEPLVKYRLHENQVGSVFRDIQKLNADQVRLRQLDCFKLDREKSLESIYLLKNRSKLDEKVVCDLFKWISLFFELNKKNKIFIQKNLENEIYKRLRGCIDKSSEVNFQMISCFFKYYLYRNFSLEKNIKLNGIFFKHAFNNLCSKRDFKT